MSIANTYLLYSYNLYNIICLIKFICFFEISLICVAVPMHVLPSKLDMPAMHPTLVKSIEKQRQKKFIRDAEEDEEIANGKVETIVYNLQSHMKLIHRLIKATRKSLDEYKSSAGVLRQEVGELRERLIEENEQVLVELSPELMNSYKHLKNDIKQQKTDNDVKYKEMLKLKKSISQSQQLLDNEVSTLNTLQDAVLGFDEEDEEM